MNAHSFLQSGNFSVRLAVKKLEDVDDGAGGFVSSWVELAPVWARLIPVEGIITRSADNQQTPISHWIYIRKRNDILPAMRFVKGARIFEISTVADPDETGRYLLCKCMERL